MFILKVHFPMVFNINRSDQKIFYSRNSPVKCICFIPLIQENFYLADWFELKGFPPKCHFSTNVAIRCVIGVFAVKCWNWRVVVNFLRNKGKLFLLWLVLIRVSCAKKRIKGFLYSAQREAIRRKGKCHHIWHS